MMANIDLETCRVWPQSARTHAQNSDQQFEASSHRIAGSTDKSQTKISHYHSTEYWREECERARSEDGAIEDIKL